MKKLPLILIIFTLFIKPVYAEAKEPDIKAKAGIVMDSVSSKVLFGKNVHEKLYPASITKVMTAIIALENGKLDQIMTASQSAINDIGPDGMNIGIIPGEQIVFKDLLNAMIVKSANEAANIIAENIGGTREAFIDLMNRKASEIGALETHFVNPSGIHNSEHYTTAYDFALIMRYALSIPEFREIASKAEYKMSVTNKHNKWATLYSANKMLKRTSPYFTRVTAAKTGFTSQAGFNLVASAENDKNTELISVVLGANSTTEACNLSQMLLEYGFNNFSQHTIVSAGDILASLPVEQAENDSTLEVVYADSISVLLPDNLTISDVRRIDHIPSVVTAPVVKGSSLGFVEFYTENDFLGKIDVVAAESIDKIEDATIISRIIDILKHPTLNYTLTIFALMLPFFILLRIVLYNVSRVVRSRR